jgi:hypothetical protein
MLSWEVTDINFETWGSQSLTVEYSRFISYYVAYTAK